MPVLHLQSHINYLQDYWVQWLLLAEFAANNVVSGSSKITLFYINKRFHSRFSLDLSQPTTYREAQDLAQHMNDIIKQLKS